MAGLNSKIILKSAKCSIDWKSACQRLISALSNIHVLNGHEQNLSKVSRQKKKKKKKKKKADQSLFLEIQIIITLDAMQHYLVAAMKRYNLSHEPQTLEKNQPLLSLLFLLSQLFLIYENTKTDTVIWTNGIKHLLENNIASGKLGKSSTL